MVCLPTAWKQRVILWAGVREILLPRRVELMVLTVVQRDRHELEQLTERLVSVDPSADEIRS